MPRRTDDKVCWRSRSAYFWLDQTQKSSADLIDSERIGIETAGDPAGRLRNSGREK